MRIEELMHTPPITCGPTDSLNVAARLMWDHDVGFVVVVGGDGRLLGVITDRDVCMAAYTKGCNLHEIPVGDVVSPQVFSCGADDSIEVAERLMSAKQVRRIPIVDDANRPIGVLSLNDVARYAITAKKREREDVAETLASICEPRPSRPATSRSLAFDSLGAH